MLDFEYLKKAISKCTWERRQSSILFNTQTPNVIITFDCLQENSTGPFKNTVKGQFTQIIKKKKKLLTDLSA